MRIEHIAIWVNDLENMKAFYEKYFNGRANAKYINTHKGFSSYFISFEEGARIELMKQSKRRRSNEPMPLGFVHFAISLDNRVEVDTLTNHLRLEGLQITGEPRTTGDGYYESTVKDPEGNTIEITC